MFRVFLDGLTNEITSKILADSIAITQTFCDEQFSLCQVAAAQLKLTTIEDLSLTNHKLYITTENTSECVCTYTVTYSAKVQNSSNVNITAYDKLKSIDTDVSAFYNGASISTVESMFNSFCTTYNLGLVANDKCANRTVQLDRTISPTKLNGLEFLGKLCEIMGIWVYQKGDSLVIENFTSSLGETITQTYGAHGYSKKDYITWDIQRVKIKTEDDDVGVTVGSGGSCYTVVANYLIYGNENLETIANGILNNIRGLQYRPCELEIPFEYAKAGAIKFNYGNDFILAMSKEIGKSIKITCKGTAYLEETESTANEMAIIKGQSNVIKNDVNGLQQRVTHIEEDYTTSADLIVAAGQIEASVISSISDDFVPTNNEEDIQKITWKMTTNDGVTINSHNVATPFQLQADGTTVLKVDSNGLTVNGSGTFSGKVTGSKVVAPEIINADGYDSLSASKYIALSEGEDFILGKYSTHKGVAVNSDGIILGIPAETRVTPTGASGSYKKMTLNDTVGTKMAKISSDGTATFQTVNVSSLSALDGISADNISSDNDISAGNEVSGLTGSFDVIKEGGQNLSAKYQPKGSYLSTSGGAIHGQLSVNETANDGNTAIGNSGNPVYLTGSEVNIANYGTTPATVNIGGSNTNLNVGGSLSVTGTISESGTSLADKYAPMDSVNSTTHGGKNLYKPTATSKNEYGVTCAPNNDGTYTLNGTSTYIIYGFDFGVITLPSGTYKGLGHPQDNNNGYWMQFLTLDETTLIGGSSNEYGNGTTITLTEQTTFKVRCVINQSVTLNNVIIKPMITTYLSTTYNDYEPYILSNRQLTDRLPITFYEIDLGNAISWNANGNLSQSFSLALPTLTDIPYVLDVKFDSIWGWNPVPHTITGIKKDSVDVTISVADANIRNNLTISTVKILVAY